MAIRIKRIDDSPARDDGSRVLIDRKWPRGVNKNIAAVAVWLRELGPSEELSHWFYNHPAQESTFRKRYLNELSNPESSSALEQLYVLATKGSTTLLHSSSASALNSVVILKDLLEGMRKPPSSTGHAKALPIGQRARRPVR